MSIPISSNGWVAIVDDDESIRRALSRLLRAHGIDAEAFHSAEDYLARVTGVPACICLDVQFEGGMSGFDLSKELRTRGNPPPIIFITAHDQSGLAAFARNEHEGVLLRKPLDVGVVLDLVTKYLGVEGTDNVA